MAKFFIKLPRAGGLCLLSKRDCLRISAGRLFCLCVPFPLLPWAAFKRRSLKLTRRHARPRKTDFSPLTRHFRFHLVQDLLRQRRKRADNIRPAFSAMCILPQRPPLSGRRGL